MQLTKTVVPSKIFATLWLNVFCRIHILYFLYVWISFNGFTIDSLENYQVIKRKPSPFLWKHINLHRTIIFWWHPTFQIENWIRKTKYAIFRLSLMKKGFQLKFGKKKCFWPLTLISDKLHHMLFWRPNYFESTSSAESNDVWHSRIVFMTIKF